MLRPSFLARLTSPNYVERMKAWSELDQEPAAAHGMLSPEDRKQLAKIIAEEEDEAVYRHAINIMLGYSCCVDKEHVRQLSPGVLPVEQTLDEWLLSDFHTRSAVFRSSEPGYERRDPDAVENLARWLPYKGFPLTKFYVLAKNEDGWQQIVTDQSLETYCFVGRLGLFGRQAVERLVNRQARFRFLRHSPPPAFPTGDELNKYYVIQEYDGDQLVNEYRAADANGVRTDYGIVQRYPIYLGTHCITVLLCAGLSSLGTVGAARWLALDLSLPQDPKTKSPILKPNAVGPHSRLEALVRTIDASRSTIWHPSEIQLVGLYVDHFEWSPPDRQWRDIQRHVVEVRMHGGKPVALFVDGEEVNMKPDSQNFRLAVTVAQEVSKNGDAGVAVTRLANFRHIWGRKIRPSKVRQRLNTLGQRTLKGLLIIGNEVRLNARVVIKEV